MVSAPPDDIGHSARAAANIYHFAVVEQVGPAHPLLLDVDLVLTGAATGKVLADIERDMASNDSGVPDFVRGIIEQAGNTAREALPGRSQISRNLQPVIRALGRRVLQVGNTIEYGPSEINDLLRTLVEMYGRPDEKRRVDGQQLLHHLSDSMMAPLVALDPTPPHILGAVGKQYLSWRSQAPPADLSGSNLMETLLFAQPPISLKEFLARSPAEAEGFRQSFLTTLTAFTNYAKAGRVAGSVQAQEQSEPKSAAAQAYAANDRQERRDVERSSLSDFAEWYEQRASQVPLLTAEEEVALAKLIEAGLYAGHLLDAAEAEGRVLGTSHRRDLSLLVAQGENAMDNFIAANRRLVISIGRSYYRRHPSAGVTLADLFQAGDEALLHAVIKFDFMRGYKFSTYATDWIRSHMSKAIEDARAVHIPPRRVSDFNRLGEIERELQQRLRRNPEPGELAVAMGATVEYIAKLRSYVSPPVSLDQSVTGTDGGVSVGDRLEDKTIHETFDRVLLWDALSRILQDRRQLYVMWRRIQGDTQAEIASTFGFTPQAIQAIEYKARALLEEVGVETMREYLR